MRSKELLMSTLGPEPRREIGRAGEPPVRIEDPGTHSTPEILKAEFSERMRPLPPDGASDDGGVPEGIRRSQDAFFRDLPELLTDASLRGRWVAYQGGERIGIAASDEPLIRECLARGLKRDEY